ncbi:MAG: uracil-DNA glycosylase, partial [Clostridia bacterium]|nr:uracil-DNA glycosylase [Clostridia bacterium]
MEAFLNELRTFTEAFQQEQPAVLGDGVRDARVMLIGEAPGEKETLEGRPFVGKAGKNLDAFLQLAGIDRKELYVSNVVKFRPTKRSKAGGIVNRPPTKKE